MKKLFLAFVAVMLVLTGCTEDNLVNESASNGKIQASFEEGLASRLAVGERNALTWSSGDAFKMFNEAGSSSAERGQCVRCRICQPQPGYEYL